ncbi:MAG: beta-ketoacyl-ACP synthase [Verrucomicrobiaceae bacterium]|nr:beta-ketoacyl-ACP synthase [Verrucomicrobiaceae bacterium]
MKFALSDLGIVCALGCGKNEVLKNALSASVVGMVKSDSVIKGSQTVLGEVSCSLPEISNSYYDTRCNQLALKAVLEIESCILDAISKYGKDRVGVVIGSSNSGMREFQNEYYLYSRCNNINKPLACHGELGNCADFLREYFKLTAPSYTISTACSSSAKAFASAQNLLKNNVVDAVIVGGADSICNFVVNGFSALGAISTNLTNPMSVNRSGINIGEGAGIFLMTKESASINLLSVGESSDAYHITSPDPSGEGAKLSMLDALKKANLQPSQIDYLNLHGTGTLFNDSMESKAVNSVFGENLKCSSTKAMTGHTLGAAGAIEAGLCYLMMSDLNSTKQLLPHVFDGNLDDKISRISLVDNCEYANVKYVLSNSFAFGGSNASVILEKA